MNKEQLQTSESGIQKSPQKKGCFSLIKDFFKEKPITSIDLDRLISNPEEFIDSGELRTSGYVRKISRQKVSWPMLRMQLAGDIMIPFIDWLTVATNIYHLRPTMNEEDEALLMSIRGSTFSIAAPINPKEKKFDSNSSYTIQGEIKTVKLEDGSETLMLKVSNTQRDIGPELANQSDLDQSHK